MADTAEALVRGTGSLHELCPAEAVTGQYAASALRAAAEGRWGHQVWCDVSPQVAPEHRGGPKVDPSAYVDPQAFVAPDVVVGPNAYVGGGAVLLAGTRVSEGARVDDRAVVGPHTDLGDRVWVGSDAHVRSARVGAGSVIEDTGIALGADPSANSVVVARRIVGDFGDGVHVVPRTLPAAEIPQRSAEGCFRLVGASLRPAGVVLLVAGGISGSRGPALPDGTAPAFAFCSRRSARVLRAPAGRSGPRFPLAPRWPRSASRGSDLDRDVGHGPFFAPLVRVDDGSRSPVLEPPVALRSPRG